MPCALCPVGGDVAKRQEYSNWRKLGFMDENNECSKDHRGDGSLWFWDSQEQLSRERHFWEEASETTTDTKSLILKIIPLHLMNPRQAKRLDNQDATSLKSSENRTLLKSAEPFWSGITCQQEHRGKILMALSYS
ncbi:uncharacterized protein LOC107051951 isoform X3 [Gallus gallus]|uniref:uncharacterized protein LOC107051951 isoform X3 n=1 Tax=Gallus gallus TaxID=9031 RepID=UPI001EFFA5FE|nr:uncharacterized protein LOC107051951 isoform X3 [Gallus gallus]XP_046792418.1 uncharacterized protein LOC107051951 isoform X3 [Gallus gallus]